MLKLLYWFDMEHFKKNGVPAIGLRYFAWDKGPVASSLYAELKDGTTPEDFKDFLVINKDSKEDDENWTHIKFRKLKNPNMDYFSRDEAQILTDTAFIFKDATGKDMTEATHERKGLWHDVYHNKGKNEEIDYMYTVENGLEVKPELAQENLQEFIGFLNLTKQYPSMGFIK